MKDGQISEIQNILGNQQGNLNENQNKLKKTELKLR